MRRAPRGRTAAALLLLLVAAGCSSLPAEKLRRLAVFDTYWEALDEQYPYFGRKGIDWHELGKQYRAVVPAAETDLDFYHVVAGMLCELNDAHVSLSVPRTRTAVAGVASTSLEDRDGFAYARIGDGFYVTHWPDGEAPVPPAHLAEELRVLPQIARIDGYRTVWSMMSLLFLGQPGTPVELLLRWHDGTLTHHVVRRPDAGTSDRAIELGPDVKITIEPPVRFDARDNYGYLRVRDFRCDGPELVRAFVTAADVAVDQAIAHGQDLVIDLRGNPGGSSSAMLPLVGRFIDAPVRLIEDMPDSSYLFGLVTYSWFATHVAPPRGVRFAGNVALLVDRSTASAAEHFARLLQLRGAILVGEPTLGAEAYLGEIDGGDGSKLSFGARSLLDERGRRLQDEGVYPDIALPLQWDDVRTAGVGAARRAWTERLLEAAQRALAAKRAAH